MWVWTGRRTHSEMHYRAALGSSDGKAGQEPEGLACSPEDQLCPASKQEWQEGWERWLFPSTVFSWDSIWSTATRFGDHKNVQKCRLQMWVQKRAMKMIRGLWRKAEGAGFSQNGDEKALERHHCSLSLLKGNLGERENNFLCGLIIGEGGIFLN